MYIYTSISVLQCWCNIAILQHNISEMLIHFSCVLYGMGIFRQKEANIECKKTKVMRFRSGAGRIRKVEWTWKGERTEEVKEFIPTVHTSKKWGGRRHR